MDTEPLRQRLPAEAEQVSVARRAVVAYARDHGANDLGAIALAVTEAVTNVVLHAYLGMDHAEDVEITAHRDDDVLEIAIADWGRGVQPRLDSPGLGLGLPIVANVADRMSIEPRDGGGTCVRMAFGCVHAAEREPALAMR